MRPVNRLLALLLGLALAGAGVVALIELVLVATDRGPLAVPRTEWDAQLRTLSWNDQTVLAALAAMTVVGLLLLAAQLVPRRPATIPLRGGSADRRAALARRGLQGQLRRVAVADHDVLDATVRVRRRRARVAAEVPADADPRVVRGRLRVALQEAVDDLGLRRPLRPVVRVRNRTQRVR